MSNFLKEAINAIDANLRVQAGNHTFLAHGLAQQVYDREGRPTPAVLVQGGQISGPDDKFDWVCYHRWNGMSLQDSPKQFGSKLMHTEFLEMILVVFIKREKSDQDFTSDYPLARKVLHALNNPNLRLKNAHRSATKATTCTPSAVDIQAAELPEGRNARFSTYTYLMFNYELVLESDPDCLGLCLSDPPAC